MSQGSPSKGSPKGSPKISPTKKEVEYFPSLTYTTKASSGKDQQSTFSSISQSDIDNRLSNLASTKVKKPVKSPRLKKKVRLALDSDNDTDVDQDDKAWLAGMSPALKAAMQKASVTEEDLGGSWIMSPVSAAGLNGEKEAVKTKQAASPRQQRKPTAARRNQNQDQDEEDADSLVVGMFESVDSVPGNLVNILDASGSDVELDGGAGGGRGSSERPDETEVESPERDGDQQEDTDEFSVFWRQAGGATGSTPAYLSPVASAHSSRAEAGDHISSALYDDLSRSVTAAQGRGGTDSRRTRPRSEETNRSDDDDDVQSFIDALLSAPPAREQRPLSAGSKTKYQRRYFQDQYSEEFQGFEPGGDESRPLSAYIDKETYMSLHRDMDKSVERRYEEQAEQYREYRRLHQQLLQAGDRDSKQDGREQLEDHYSPSESRGSRSSSMRNRDGTIGGSAGATDDEQDGDGFAEPPVIEVEVKSLREQLLEDELRQAEALVQKTNYFAFLNGAGDEVDEEKKEAAVALMKLRERQAQSKTWLEHYYPQLSRKFYPPMLPWSLLLTYFVQYNVHLSVHPQIILPEMVLCCKNRASDKQLFSFRWIYNTGNNNANAVDPSVPAGHEVFNGVSFSEREFNANNIIHYYFQEALEQQQQRAAAGKVSPSEMVIASLHSEDGKVTKYLNMAEFYKMFGTAAMVSATPNTSRPQSSQNAVFSSDDSPMCFRNWRANDTLIFQAHPLDDLQTHRFECRYENFVKEGIEQFKYFRTKTVKLGGADKAERYSEVKVLSPKKYGPVLDLCEKILAPFILQLKDVLAREFNRIAEVVSVSFFLKDGAVFWITDINVQRRPYVPPASVMDSLCVFIEDAQHHVVESIDNMLARKTARKFSYQLLRRCVLVSTAFELARRNMAPVITKGIYLATQADIVTEVLQDAKNTVAEVLDDTITEFAMISVEGAMEGQSIVNDASVDQAVSEIELVFKVGGCARTVANRVVANIDEVRMKSLQDRKDYIASFVNDHAFSGQYMPFSKVLSVLVNFASDSLVCSLKLVDTFLYDKENGGVCWYYTDTNFHVARRNKVAMKSVTSKFLGYYNKNKELCERRRAASRLNHKRVDGAETDGWMDEAASVCSEVSNASYTSILEHGEEPDAPPVPAGIMTNSDGSSIVLGLDSMNTLLKSKLTNLKLTKTSVTQIALPRMHDEDANGSIVYLLRFRQFGAQPHDVRVDYAARDPADLYETFAPRYSNISPYTPEFEEAFGEDLYEAKLQMESTIFDIIRFFDVSFGVSVIDAIFEFIQDRHGVMWLSFISHFGVMHPVDLFTAQYANQRVPKLLCYIPRNTPAEQRNAVTLEPMDWQTMYYDKQQLQANVGSMGADHHVASNPALQQMTTNVSEVTLDRGLASMGGDTDGGESMGHQSITEISSDAILCWADLLEYLCYCTVYGAGENHSSEDPEPDVLPFLLPDTIISDETDNQWDKQHPCLRCYFLHPVTGKLCCARHISTEQMLDQCSAMAADIKRKNATLLTVAPYVALLHHHTDGWQNLKEITVNKMDKAGLLLGGKKANFLQLNNGSGARVSEFFVCSYVRVQELNKYTSIFERTFSHRHVDMGRGSGMQFFIMAPADNAKGSSVIRCEDTGLNAQMAEITTQVLRIIASTSFKLVLNLSITCYKDKNKGMMVAGVTDIIVKDVTFEDLLLKEAGIADSPPEKVKPMVEAPYVPAFDEPRHAPILEEEEDHDELQGRQNRLDSVSSIGSPVVVTESAMLRGVNEIAAQDDEEKNLITCPACEISLLPEFKFCYSCGQQLGPVVESPERNVSSRAKTVPRGSRRESLVGSDYADEAAPSSDGDDRSLVSLLTDGAGDLSLADHSLFSDVKGVAVMDMSVADSGSMVSLHTMESGDSHLSKVSIAVNSANEPPGAVYPDELPEAEWGSGVGIAERLVAAEEEASEGGVEPEEDVGDIEYTPFQIQAVPRRLSGSASGQLHDEGDVLVGGEAKLSDENASASRVGSPSVFNYAKMAAGVLKSRDAEGVDLRPRASGPLMPTPSPIELYHMNRLEIFDLLLGVSEDDTVKVGPGIKTPMLLFYDAEKQCFGMCECAGKGVFSKFTDIPCDTVAKEVKRTIRNYPSGHSVEALLYDMETNDHQLLNSDEFVEFINNGFAALKSNPDMVVEVVFVPVKVRSVNRFAVRVEQHNLDHHASSNRNLVNYADSVITIQHDICGELGDVVSTDEVSIADTRKITTILLRFLRFLALGCGYAVADCSAVFSKFDTDWEVSLIHISYYSVDRPMSSMLAEPESFAAVANMGRNCHIRLEELTYVDLLEAIVERGLNMPFVKILPIAINTSNSMYYHSPKMLRDYDDECRFHHCYFSLKTGAVAKTKVVSWEMVRASFSNFARAQLPPTHKAHRKGSPSKVFADGSLESFSAFSQNSSMADDSLSLTASIEEQVASSVPVPPIAMLCNFLPAVQPRGVGLLDDVLARPGTSEAGTAGAHLFTEAELVQWLATRGITSSGHREFYEHEEDALAVSQIRSTLGDYLQVYMPSHCAAVEEKMRKRRIRQSAKDKKRRVGVRAPSNLDEDSVGGADSSVLLEESSEEDDARVLHMRKYMPKVAEDEPFTVHNSHREIRLYCKYVHSARDNNTTYENAMGVKLGQNPSLEEWEEEDDYEREIHGAYNTFQFGYREIHYKGSASAIRPLGQRRREKAHQAYCNSHSSPPVTASGKTRPIHRKNMCKYDLDDEALCSQMMDISKKFLALFDSPMHADPVPPAQAMSVSHMRLYRAEFEFVYNIHTQQLWLSWVKDVFAYIPTPEEIKTKCDIDGRKIEYLSRLKMTDVLDQLLSQHATKEEALRLEQEERQRQAQEREWAEQERQWLEQERLRIEEEALEEELEEERRVAQLEKEMDDLALSTINGGDEGSLFDHSVDGEGSGERDALLDMDDVDSNITLPPFESTQQLPGDGSGPSSEVPVTITSGRDYFDDGRSYDRVMMYDAEALLASFQNSSRQSFISFSGCVFVAKGGSSLIKDDVAELGDCTSYLCILACSEEGALENVTITLCEKESNASLTQVPPTVLCVPTTLLFENILRIWEMKGILPLFTPMTDDYAYLLPPPVEEFGEQINKLTHWFTHSLSLFSPDRGKTRVPLLDTDQLELFLMEEVQEHLQAAALSIERVARGRMIRQKLRRYLDEKRREREYTTLHGDWRAYIPPPTRGIAHNWRVPPEPPPKKKKKKVKKIPGYMQAAAKAKAEYLLTVSQPLPGRSKPLHAMRLPKFATPTASSKIKGDPAEVKRKRILDGLMAELANDLVCSAIDSFFNFEPVHFDFRQSLELLEDKHTPSLVLPLTVFLELPRITLANSYTTFRARMEEEGALVSQRNLNPHTTHNCLECFDAQPGNATLAQFEGHQSSKLDEGSLASVSEDSSVQSAPQSPMTPSRPASKPSRNSSRPVSKFGARSEAAIPEKPLRSIFIYGDNNRILLSHVETNAVLEMLQAGGKGKSNKRGSAALSNDPFSCSAEDRFKFISAYCRSSSDYCLQPCLLTSQVEDAEPEGYRIVDDDSEDAYANLVYCEFVNTNEALGIDSLTQSVLLESLVMPASSVGLSPSFKGSSPGKSTNKSKGSPPDSKNVNKDKEKSAFSLGDWQMKLFRYTDARMVDRVPYEPDKMTLLNFIKGKRARFNRVAFTMLAEIFNVFGLEHNIELDRIYCNFALCPRENGVLLTLSNIVSAHGARITPAYKQMAGYCGPLSKAPRMIAEPLAAVMSSPVPNRRPTQIVTKTIKVPKHKYEARNRFYTFEELLSWLSTSLMADVSLEGDVVETATVGGKAKVGKVPEYLDQFLVPLTVFKEKNSIISVLDGSFTYFARLPPSKKDVPGDGEDGFLVRRVNSDSESTLARMKKLSKLSRTKGKTRTSSAVSVDMDGDAGSVSGSGGAPTGKETEMLLLSLRHLGDSAYSTLSASDAKDLVALKPVMGSETVTLTEYENLVLPPYKRHIEKTPEAIQRYAKLDALLAKEASCLQLVRVRTDAARQENGVMHVKCRYFRYDEDLVEAARNPDEEPDEEGNVWVDVRDSEGRAITPLQGRPKGRIYFTHRVGEGASARYAEITDKPLLKQLRSTMYFLINKLKKEKDLGDLYYLEMDGVAVRNGMIFPKGYVPPGAEDSAESKVPSVGSGKGKSKKGSGKKAFFEEFESEMDAHLNDVLSYPYKPMAVLPPISKAPVAPRQPTFKYSVWMSNLCCYNCDYVRVEYEEEQQVEVEEEIPEEVPSPAALMAEGAYKSAVDKSAAIRELIDAAIASNQAILNGGPRPRTVHERKAQAALEDLPVDDAKDLVVRRLADVSAQVERLAGLYLKQPELARQEEVERLRRLEAEAEEDQRIQLQQRQIEMTTMELKIKSNDYAILQRVVSEQPLDARNALHRAATPAAAHAERPERGSIDFFTFCKKVCNSQYTNIFIPFTAFPDPLSASEGGTTYCAFYATSSGTLSMNGSISVEKMMDISAVYQAYFNDAKPVTDKEEGRNSFSAFACFIEDKESCYEYTLTKESPAMTVTTFLFPFLTRQPVGRSEVEGVSAVNTGKKDKLASMFAKAGVSTNERMKVADCHRALFSPERLREDTARSGKRTAHSKISSFLQADYYMTGISSSNERAHALGEDLYYLCFYEYRPPVQLDRKIDPLCYHFLRIECRRKSEHLQRNHALDTVLQTLNTTLAEIITQPVSAGRYISADIQKKLYLLITECIVAFTEPDDPSSLIISATGLELVFDPRKSVLWLLNALYCQYYPNSGLMASDYMLTLSTISHIMLLDPFGIKSAAASRSPTRGTEREEKRSRDPRPLGFDAMRAILNSQSSIRFDKFHETSPEDMLNLVLSDKLRDLMRSIPEPVPTPPSMSRANTPTIEGNIEDFIDEIIEEEAVDTMASMATMTVYRNSLKELYAWMLEEVVAEEMLRPVKLTKKQRKAIAAAEAEEQARVEAEAKAREEEAKRAAAPVTFMAVRAAGLMKGFLKKKMADVSLGPVETVAEHEPKEEELKVVRGALLKGASKKFAKTDLVEDESGATLKPLPPSKKKTPLEPIADAEAVKSPRQKKVKPVASEAVRTPSPVEVVKETTPPASKPGMLSKLTQSFMGLAKTSPPAAEKPVEKEKEKPVEKPKAVEAPPAPPSEPTSPNSTTKRKKRLSDGSSEPSVAAASVPVVSSPGSPKGRKKRMRNTSSASSIGSPLSPPKARNLKVTNTVPFAMSWSDILEKFVSNDKFRMLIPANIFYTLNEDINQPSPASYTGYFNMAGGAVSSKANFETSKIVGSFKKFVETQKKNTYNYVAVLSFRKSSSSDAQLIDGESKESEEALAARASERQMERIYLTAAELRTLLLVSTATAGATAASIGPSSIGSVVNAMNEATTEGSAGSGLAKFKSMANMAAKESRNDKLMRFFKQSPDNGCAEPSHIHVYVKSKVFETSVTAALQAQDGAATQTAGPHIGTDPTNTVIHAVFNNSDVGDDLGSTNSSPSRAGTAVSNSALNKRVEKGLKLFVRTSPDHNGVVQGFAGAPDGMVPMEEYFIGIEEYIVTKDALVQAIQKVMRQLTVAHSSLQVVERKGYSEVLQVETTVEKASFDIVIDASNMVWFLYAGVDGTTVTMTGKE